VLVKLSEHYTDELVKVLAQVLGRYGMKSSLHYDQEFVESGLAEGVQKHIGGLTAAKYVPNNEVPEPGKVAGGD